MMIQFGGEEAGRLFSPSQPECKPKEHGLYLVSFFVFACNRELQTWSIYKKQVLIAFLSST